uniref:Uncharacterized protein n=1 Tax=Timema bartmani TaxID=61472 RepID=A0A7R9EZV5_9NEOP|nr:unnamed protein product [Timema bartmani]
MAIISPDASLANKAMSSSSRAHLRTFASILYVDASCMSEEPAGPLQKKQVDSEWLSEIRDNSLKSRNYMVQERNKYSPPKISLTCGHWNVVTMALLINNTRNSHFPPNFTQHFLRLIITLADLHLIIASGDFHLDSVISTPLLGHSPFFSAACSFHDYDTYVSKHVRVSIPASFRC